MNLSEKINALKEKNDMVILAHNYQPPEVQDIADHMGDSLELCYLAQRLDADVLVFAGVSFMAESALILNPEKTVLLPEPNAVCPMAEMLSPDAIVKKKEEYPDAAVVMYGNTTAFAKAESDVICTSANAGKIVNSLKEDTVLFGPDRNLRYWTQKQTDKDLIPVPDHGYCYVHNSLITLDDILGLKSVHPDAEVLVHPECTPAVQDAADEILSTNGMLRHAKESGCDEFIIGTEKEMCYRLSKVLPEKSFYPIETAVCSDMKKVTLEKLYVTMRDGSNKVSLPQDIIERAQMPLKRMLEISR